MKATTETVRQETHQGRDFTVVPVIAIVEGVLQAANSPQPELVKAEEFDPAAWNGRPITFGHPTIGDLLVSASTSPEIFEEVAIGTIFNSVVINDKKLRVEAWIDNEKAEALEGDALKAFERLKAGESIEVSSGYFADSEQESGKFDGEKFEAIQSGIKPDHLAILLGDDIGACSLEDGCGTNRVNSFLLNQLGVERTSELKGFGNRFGKTLLYGFDKHDPEEDAKKKAEEEEEEENKKNKSNLSLLLESSQLKDNGEISDNDVRSAISSALESKGENFWSLIAVFKDNFIFEKNFGTLERRSFSIADNGEVTIGNEGEVVRPVTEFVPVKSNEENEMNKAEIVNSLIGNEATQFSEENRSFLEDLEESTLALLTPVEIEKDKEEEKEVEGEKKEVEASAVKETKEAAPQTTEDYIAAAPDEIKEVLNQGIKMHSERRGQLTKAITDNSQFSEDEIKEYPLEQLEKLAVAVAPKDQILKTGPVSNLGEDSEKTPKAPLVWPKKEVKKAS